MKIIKKTLSLTGQVVLGLLAGIGAVVSLGWFLDRTSEKSLNNPFAGVKDTSMDFVNN